MAVCGASNILFFFILVVNKEVVVILNELYTGLVWNNLRRGCFINIVFTNTNTNNTKNDIYLYR